jgi:hypothetical protein
MTFIPLTPSVGKEKRILEGVKKSQSWIALVRAFDVLEARVLTTGLR